MQLDSLETTKSCKTKRLTVAASYGLAATVSVLPTMASGGFEPIPPAPPNFSHASSNAQAWLHPSAGTSLLTSRVTESAAARALAEKTSTVNASLNSFSSTQRPFQARSLNLSAVGTNDINLESSQSNILASNLAGFHTLTIIVGGVRQTVSLSSRLTGAEAVAAQEVLDGGNQTIKIGAGGQAKGGTFALTSNMLSGLDRAVGGSIASLTIAPGVKVIDELSLLQIGGNLDNYGSILTAAGSLQALCTISASSIINAAGASISAYKGSSDLHGTDPLLSAQSSISNSGTISSAGNLTLTAPLISNLSTESNYSPSSIYARQNLTVNTALLINNSLISTSNGNIAISPTSGALTLGNGGGTIKAATGDIDFSTNNANFNLSGGNLLSNQINIKALTGEVNLAAQTVSGTINASGDSVHITTASSQNLGNIDTSGDPQFVSTAGNITINGTIAPTDGAALAIIAGGNIVSTSSGQLITSSQASGNGGNLTVIAGANVTGNDTIATVTDSLSAGKGSTTGGIIDLTGGSGGHGAISQISTAGAGSGNGGYVQMIAYAGTTSGSGAIKLPSSLTINASASGTGTAGDVVLIAGATKGLAIATGDITANQLSISTGTPSANGSSPAGIIFTGGANNLGISAFTTGADISNDSALITTGKLTAANIALTSGGGAGTAGKPVIVDSSQLSINAASSLSSAYITDESSTALDLSMINLGVNGTFSLTAPTTHSVTNGAININGPVTAGAFKISQTVINSSITIADAIMANKTTLSTPGDITTTGAGQIVGSTATVNGAALDIATDVSALNLKTVSGGATIVQGSTPLTLTATVASAPGNNLVVDSQNQINLKNQITLSQGTVTLADFGSAGGIKLDTALNAATVNLTAGSAGITSSGTIKAGIINLTSAGNIGSASGLLRVNNDLALGLGNSLSIMAGSGTSTYIQDLGKTDLNFDAGSVTTGNVLTLISAASALNLVEAPFNTISIKDTNSLGAATLNSNSLDNSIIGTGLGPISLRTNGAISMNFSTAGVQATAVSLITAKGSIAQTGDLVLNTPSVSFQAREGNVSMTDLASGNIAVVGTTPDAFYFISTGNNANLSINSPIKSTNILLTTEGTNGNITVNAALGAGANDKGNSITITPTDNLTVNGTITDDYMILGGNRFTGDPILLGTVNINKPLIADHSINMFVNQSSGININAPLQANGLRLVTANAGAHIVLNASLTGVKDREGDGIIVTVQADNANIISKTGVSVTGAYLSLTGNNIGTAAAPLMTVSNTINLAVGGGSAYINNSGNLTLATFSPVTGATISLKTNGSLNFDGSISASYLSISATGSVTIGQQFESPLSSLVGLTNLTMIAGGGILDYANLGGPNITVNTPALTLSGINLVATGNLTISNTSGSLIIDGNFSGNNVTLNSSGSLSVGTSTDNSPGTVTASNILTLQGSSINNFATVSGATVSIDTTTFTNKTSTTTAGTLATLANLSFTSTTGNLDLIGASGSVTTAAGGSLSLVAPGSITVASSNLLTDVASGQLHALTINAGGIFTSPFSSFTVAPDALGNGGIINIKAANLAYNGHRLPPAAFALNASGSKAAGGQITLNLTKAAGGVVIGAGVNDYNFNASGTNGGSAVVSSSGNLTVNTNYLNVSPSSGGNGSNISLLAGANLLINGDIDTHSGTGTYGNVALQSNANTTFAIGGTTSTTNGIVGLSAGTGGGVLGNSVTIINKGGVQVNSGFLISAQNAGITLDTTTLINNGQVNTQGTLTITNGAGITLPEGTTGTFLSSMSGLAVISANGNVNLQSTLPPVSNLQLSAIKGTLSLAPGTSSFTAVTTAGDGGRIDIAAKSINGSITTLNAAATTATGAGGTISLTLTGTSAATIAAGTSFDVAKGALSTQGGSLTISNGGNLTIDASALTLGPTLAGATGADLTLQAGSKGAGALLVSNSAQIADQVVNNLSLLSNSSKSFILDGAASKGNGLTDSHVSLSAQTIAVQNSGGGIVFGSAGTLTANASGRLTSFLPALILISGKGDIGAPSAPVNIDSASIAISASGSAYLANPTAASLNPVTVGKTFSYTSSTAITAVGNLAAPTLVLNVSSINQPLQANSTNNISIEAASGLATITDSQTSAITVTNLTAPAGISLVAGGSIVLAPSALVIGANVTLTAAGSAGNITLNAPVTSSGTVSLAASGNGTITANGTASTISASSINLVSQSGNIGSSRTKLLTVDTANLNVMSKANAFIQNANFAPTVAADLAGTFNYSGNLGGSSATLLAPNLNLNLGTNTALLNVNASSLTASTTFGDLIINDNQTAIMTLGSLNAAAGQITFTGGGAVSINGIINGSNGVTLSAGGINGSITISKAITATSGAVVLAASEAGTITNTAEILSAKSIALTTQGANIGSQNKAVTTSTSNLSVNTGLSGNVYVSNTDSHSNGLLWLTAAQVGSIQLTETNTTSKNSGSLLVNNISAGSGQIFIISNEQSLSVSAGSVINTFNGNITLQNKYGANSAGSPLISIGDNSTIHASANPASNLDAGNVLVVLGAIPAPSSLSAGITPSGAPTINISGSGSVTFGNTSNANGSITAAPRDTLNGLNRSLAFSTGQNAASQIVLGNNVTITADPSFVATASNTVQTLRAGGDSIVQSLPGASMEQSAIASQSLLQAPAQTYLSNQSQTLNQTLNQTLFPTDMSGQIQSYLPVQLQMQMQSQKKYPTTQQEAARPQSHKLQGSIMKTNNKHSENREILNCGANLFAPDQNTLVETPFATVRIARGAVALVIVSTASLSVYNLHDRRHGALAIQLQEDPVPIYLSPGRNATITADTIDNFERINACGKVAYRRMKRQTLESGRHLFQSEFDLFSMLRSLRPLSAMLDSNDSAIQKTAENVLKTAAILAQINTGEPYIRLAVPTYAAMAEKH